MLKTTYLTGQEKQKEFGAQFRRFFIVFGRKMRSKESVGGGKPKKTDFIPHPHPKRPNNKISAPVFETKKSKFNNRLHTSVQRIKK